MNIYVLTALAVGCFVFFFLAGWKIRKQETSWLAHRLRKYQPEEERKSVFSSLEKAASRAGLKIMPAHLIGSIIVGALAGAGFGLVVTGKTNFMILGLITGAAAPVSYVRSQIRGRKEAFEIQFEECLQKISSAMRAGMSVGQAIVETARTANEPAKSVFQRIVTLHSTGYSLTKAVEEASQMVASRDMELMASAIALHLQMGSNLPEVLDQIAMTIRERQSFRGKVAAATAEGRLTANVLVLLPFAAIAIFRKMSPEYMYPLFNTPGGVMVFWVCSGLIALGWLILRNMASMEDL